MKYARQTIELMSPYPGRPFRIGDIVRYVNPHATSKERQRIRVGVSRVLFALVDTGSVTMIAPKCERSFAVYSWRSTTGI